MEPPAKYITRHATTSIVVLFVAAVIAGCAATETSSAVQQPTPELFSGPQQILNTPVQSSSDLPALLIINDLDVAMTVVPVGLEADGAMEIPDDVAVAGHYNPNDLGVLPGAAGTAVFAAHVDSRSQGRGALYALDTLDINDEIRVAGHNGVETLWRVTDVTSYRKEVVPLADIFTFSGASRIAVITCGGTFDRLVGAYTHNVVVLAEPVLRANG